MTRATNNSDDVLTFTDQVMFLALRATGAEAVAQANWIYEHPVDYDGLRKFFDEVGYGLMGRRIEPSPLPFGRHRWVTVHGPQRELDIAEPRPRAELGDWIDERTSMPLDPEHGPSWHMGVLPMTDGSTAVSLTASHCIGDGSAGVLALLEGVHKARLDHGWGPPGARTRRQAIVEDLRVTARGLPELGRTLVAAAKLARAHRHEISRSGASRVAKPTGPDHPVQVPTLHAFIPTDEWDARAKELGGNSYSLVAGFAAKLSERLGRHRAEDGLVTLNVPQADRQWGDTRANAVILSDVVVDPTKVTADLGPARSALKEGITKAREVPDEMLALLPLVPWVPKRAVHAVADALFGFSADMPVSCSNMGDLPSDVALADGTAAEYMFFRGVDRTITRHSLEKRGGLLTVVALRVNGKLSLGVVAYQPGAGNTKAWLRELITGTLADFGLTGHIE
ncbi:wax ester/triacylglycerol synthase domain-containing protein [Mycobacterium sp. BMJ-28]